MIVEPNKWLNHFKSFYTTVAKNFENRFQELDSLLSEKEYFHNIFNELDYKESFNSRTTPRPTQWDFKNISMPKI